MKNRLIEIIKELKEVIKETELEVTDDNILTQASTFLRGELVNSGKPKEEPITEKQANFIKKHEKGLKEKGFDVANIQYKSQATAIIKEFTKDWK